MDSRGIGIMDDRTQILIELIGRCGYRVSVAAGRVDALNLETGARFIVRGDDVTALVDKLSRMLRIDL